MDRALEYGFLMRLRALGITPKKLGYDGQFIWIKEK